MPGSGTAPQAPARLQGYSVPAFVSEQGPALKPLQRGKWNVLRFLGGPDCDAPGKRRVHEHEKRCGFSGGLPAEPLRAPVHLESQHAAP